MWTKVWDFVRETKMLQAGDRIVIAVSGGADSVCLLKVLTENQIDLRLRAVHVHHGLRGGEADQDAEFVREICKRVGVPLEVVYRNVREYADRRGLSEEEAGRILRYEALEEAAGRWEQEAEGRGEQEAERSAEQEAGRSAEQEAGRRVGQDTERKSGQAEGEKADEEGEAKRSREKCSVSRPVWIAVAHHQDDNAETILHHLLRGSGLRGLSGMKAVQGNRIRPLLGVRRSEIVTYLRDSGWSWCEDSSNNSGAYTRNRIRHELIPYMTEHINVRAVENLLHAGELLGQADQYLECQADMVWRQYGRVEAREDGRRERVMIDREGFLAQEQLIRSYLIRHMLGLAAPGQKDITAKHIRQIGRLAEGAVGGRCDLPGDLRAVRTYQDLCLECNQEKRCLEEMSVSLPMPGQESVRFGDWEFRVFFREKGAEIPKKEYTKWFDYDRIKDTLSIRCRQSGDFLILPGGGRKRLNRFLIDEKILREQRDRIPVLTEGNQVLWVVGYRISEYYKIREATHTILQVDFYGGKAYGR